MCPFKRYKQREIVKLWLTPDIYREMRYREKCLNVFRSTRCQQYYKSACASRNKINAMIDQAKSNYFKNILNTNSKNPKKFWRILKDFTDNSPDKNISSNFFEPETNIEFSSTETPDFFLMPIL